MRSRIKISPLGWTAAALVVVVIPLAAILDWVELAVLGASCFLAWMAAIPFVVGRLALDVDRILSPARVMVGGSAKVSYRILNPSDRNAAARTVEDSVAGVRLPISIPRLAPKSAVVSRDQVLDTSKRGVLELGPAVIAKSDPLGFVRREVVHRGVDHFYVHPYHELVRPLPVGYAKDLEGPTSDASPVGDVAFHAIREYQYGDDFRHIHWASTAKTGWLSKPQSGSLMVRHYVDNRLPHVTVVLDTRRHAYESEEAFEVAIQITASVGVASLRDSQPFALHAGGHALLGQSVGGSGMDLLDRLAGLGNTDSGSLDKQAMDAMRAEMGTSVALVVTGGVATAELLPVVSRIKRIAQPVIVRVWPTDSVAGKVPGATVIDAGSLAAFRAQWERIT